MFVFALVVALFFGGAASQRPDFWDIWELSSKKGEGFRQGTNLLAPPEKYDLDFIDSKISERIDNIEGFQAAVRDFSEYLVKVLASFQRKKTVLGSYKRKPILSLRNVHTIVNLVLKAYNAIKSGVVAVFNVVADITTAITFSIFHPIDTFIFFKDDVFSSLFDFVPGGGVIKHLASATS